MTANQTRPEELPRRGGVIAWRGRADGRLQPPRRDLLGPRLADRSIAAIAFGWGFGDLSGFNRAFRAALGATPREVRAHQSEPARG